MVNGDEILLGGNIQERKRQFGGAMVAFGVKAVRNHESNHSIAYFFRKSGWNIFANNVTEPDNGFALRCRHPIDVFFNGRNIRLHSNDMNGFEYQ